MPFEILDFHHFHTVDLPARLAAGNGKRAATQLQGVRPIAFRLADDGRAYTYTPTADGIAITPGDADAHTVVELSQVDWSNFVWGLLTSLALAGAEDFQGRSALLRRWEPALRVAFDGQAIYDLADPPPIAADLSRSFTLDDSDDDISAFLNETGFVHVRAVFSGEEVAALRADVEAAVARARPGDGTSLWTSVDGVEVCGRMNHLNEHSERIARLGSDPRLLRIAALDPVELHDAIDRVDGNIVITKVPGAETPLTDLPFHRDCWLGGHPVLCPLLNVAIQLDAATAASGRLHMIAGSHLGVSLGPTAAEAARLPIVAIDTRPGDVTAHYAHTLHATPPPEDRSGVGRRALYLKYVPDLVFEVIPPGKSYNEAVFPRDPVRFHHDAPGGVRTSFGRRLARSLRRATTSGM